MYIKYVFGACYLTLYALQVAALQKESDILQVKKDKIVAQITQLEASIARYMILISSSSPPSPPSFALSFGCFSLPIFCPLFSLALVFQSLPFFFCFMKDSVYLLCVDLSPLFPSYLTPSALYNRYKCEYADAIREIESIKAEMDAVAGKVRRAEVCICECTYVRM